MQNFKSIRLKINDTVQKVIAISDKALSDKKKIMQNKQPQSVYPNGGHASF